MPSTSIGQSFTAHYDGLAGAAFLIEPGESKQGSITFHLRSSPHDNTDIRSVTLGLEEISASQTTIFHFSPLTDSNHTSYFLILDLQGDSSAQISLSSKLDYPDGALYKNNDAQDQQLAFSLVYSSVHQILGIFTEFYTWLVWMLAGLFLYILPGWALLRFAWPGWSLLSGWARLGLSGGLSLAIYPILFLLAALVDIRPGWLFAVLPGSMGICYLLWVNKNGFSRLTSLLGDLRRNFNKTGFTSFFHSPDLLLSFLVILVFGARFWAIRTLDAPMWGDSVQHTVMAQLFLDNLGLFSSWEPYAPYHSLTVHFGFPVHAALFAWLSGLPSHTAALITAQWINGFAVVALIPLAIRISRKNTWAAVGAVLAAGLIAPMPAFYVNWGRFAQLDGQAILPVSIWLAWELLDQARMRVDAGSSPIQLSKIRQAFPLKSFWIPALIAGMTLAGMCLSYYRMIFYYAMFFAALTIGWILSRAYQNLTQWISLGLGVAVIGFSSFLVLLPWLVNVMNSALSGMVSEGMSVGSDFSLALIDLQEWLNLETYLPVWLAVIACAALIWSFIKKRWEISAIGLWVVFLQAYQVGKVIQLPGANMLQVFAILIWIYMPAALLVGWFLGEFVGWLESRGFQSYKFGLIGTLVLLALVTANQTRLISQPLTYNMVTAPDLRAMEWIRQRIPDEARFLVEMWRIYEGRSAVGTDAGWWLPLFSGRENTMPPQYALLSEVPQPPDYSTRVVELTAALEKSPPSDPQNLALLCSEEITHIYIGQLWGNIGAGTGQLFLPENLLNHPEFNLEYHQDRVHIFSLAPSVCGK